MIAGPAAAGAAVLHEHLDVLALATAAARRPAQVALAVRAVLEELPLAATGSGAAAPMWPEASMTSSRSGRRASGTHRCVVDVGITT